MKIDFDLIQRLKFQEPIKINKKTLSRAQEYPEWNSQEDKIEYLFYDFWDKKKNLLPKPSHKVILQIHLKREKKSDGWVKNKIKSYGSGKLVDLKNKKTETINSLEK